MRTGPSCGRLESTCQTDTACLWVRLLPAGSALKRPAERKVYSMPSCRRQASTAFPHDQFTFGTLLAVISLRNVACRQAPEQKRLRRPEGASSRFAPQYWHEAGFAKTVIPIPLLKCMRHREWMKMTRIEDQDGRLLISSYALKATLRVEASPPALPPAARPPTSAVCLPF
jgi:hypothetical protein